MQKLAVVYFPKTNLDKINSFREKYDLNWRIIPPHITIVSPLSNMSENQLVEHVDNIIKDLPGFSIHLTGLTKSFDDNNLFLKVKEGNDEIVHLHDKLYSAILSSYLPTEYAFEPHITLGMLRRNDDKFNDRLDAEAKSLNFDLTCDFDAVSVIKGDGVSPARIIKSIKLRS